MHTSCYIFALLIGPAFLAGESCLVTCRYLPILLATAYQDLPGLRKQISSSFIQHYVLCNTYTQEVTMWQRNHVPMCDSDLYTMEEPQPQARLSPRTEQREQELEKRRKRRRRATTTTTTTTRTTTTTTTTAKPTNEGPMKGQKQVKHTHQIQCQLSFKKQTKTQTVKSGVWQYKKELTHLNIKTIIAITTWTKMGAHSKSWIMTHDAKITGNKKYNSQCQSWLEARKVWGW